MHCKEDVVRCMRTAIDPACCEFQFSPTKREKADFSVLQISPTNQEEAGFSVRLRKKRGGFGMSISDDTAEVLKLLQEQDGSDGPAAEQGVRIGVYVVAVVRSRLLRSAE